MKAEDLMCACKYSAILCMIASTGVCLMSQSWDNVANMHEYSQ